VHLRFFGGAGLYVDGMPVGGRAAHRRRLALLAIMSAAPPAGVSRERLVALLWPDASADKGRRLLSEAVYQIRKELGDLALVGSGEMLAVDATVLPSDVREFREAVANGRLAEAATLYTAPFLDAWYVEEAPDFERWASETRQALEGEYRIALTTLVAASEGNGAWADASRWLGLLAKSDAYNPETAIRYATALQHSSGPAAALLALTTHVEQLQRELELPPAPSVSRLISALRQPAPAAGSAVMVSPDGSRTTPVLTPHSELGVISSPMPAPPPLVAGDVVDTPREAAPDPVSSAPMSLVGRRSRRGVVAALAVSALVLSGVATRLLSRPTAPTRDVTRLAVLYFDDHSEGRRLQHLADGLTEELIHQLAGVPALEVISRNGVKRFREAPMALDSVVSALDVGTIIEGSVQESGDSIRVTMQVIDGNTGAHTHSEVFQRQKSEIFQLEAQLASSVAAALRRRLGRTIVLRSLTEGASESEALSLVYRARRLREDMSRIAMHPDAPDRRSAGVLLQQADSMLREAQRLDSDWATPALERGWLWMTASRLSLSVSPLGTVEVIADSLHAVDSLNAEALYLRGAARWRQSRPGPGFGAAMARAEADLRRSVLLDSTRAQAWAELGELLMIRGAFAESAVASQRALVEDVWLEGADQTYFMGFASTHMLGRYDAARDWCTRGRLAFPGSWRFYECELTILRDDTRRAAQPKQAWALVATLDSLDPPAIADSSSHAYSAFYRRALAAAISARAGDRPRAWRELRVLRARVEADSVLAVDFLYDEAAILFHLGDVAGAHRSLRALQSLRPMLAEMLQRDSLVVRVSRASNASR
jgi:TolB-like protein/DNA-binding SARP family transcriptional activator